MSDAPDYWVPDKSARLGEKCVPITDPVDLLAYYICEPGFRGHFRGTSGLTRYDCRKVAERIMERFDVTPKKLYTSQSGA